MNDVYTEFRDALHEVQRASGLGATRLGRALGVSRDTVKSLLTGRRRPGVQTLLACEDAAVRCLVRVARDGEAPASSLWWRFLDAALRCRLFPFDDATGVLRGELRRALDDGLVPEITDDPAWETVGAFLRGGAPSRDLLAAVCRDYRAEAERLLLQEGEVEDALRCREVALVAEGGAVS